METKMYAILMKKVTIKKGIYLFLPENLIIGELIEDEEEYYFNDELAQEYLTMDNAELVFEDTEKAVGFAVDEEYLLHKFPNCSIAEAKSQYYDLISSLTYIGIYLMNEDKIVTIPLDLEEISERFNQADLSSENVVNVNFAQLPQPLCDEFGIPLTNRELAKLPVEEQEIECVAIEKSKYEQLLQKKTYEEVIEELQKIYDKLYAKSENISYPTTSIGKDILEFFSTSREKFYSQIKNLNDTEKIKKVMKEYQEDCLKFTVEFEQKYASSACNTEMPIDLIWTLVDLLDSLFKEENIEKLRQEITTIEESAEPYINQAAYSFELESNKKEEKTTKEEVDAIEKEAPQPILDVKKIKEFFDQRILGQEEAKIDVISAIVMNKLTDDPLTKNSCLLVGPTGSGKTLIASTVSEYFQMPMEIIDATQLTVAGYVGANVEDALVRLLDKAKGNLEVAEQGIIVFDEIDKKGSEKNSDVSGKGVLNTLLNFIQGTTYDINYKGRIVSFNTAKLTIFATGAFTDVAKAKKENKGNLLYSNNSIGFLKQQETVQEDITYGKLEIQDFVKYGHMPVELMGRFTTISQLHGHTKESLIKILVESTVSPLLAEYKKLAKINIFISWEEGYLEALAEEALKLQTGGRSLKNKVEQSIKMARWQVLQNMSTYYGIHLKRETVFNNLDCDLIGIDGIKYKLQDLVAEDEVKLLKRTL